MKTGLQKVEMFLFYFSLSRVVASNKLGGVITMYTNYFCA